MGRVGTIPEKTANEGIRPENYRLLQSYLRERSGVVLEADKGYLVAARLGPLAQDLGLAGVDDLCALLWATQDAEVGRRVVEAMTTNETYFFRDPAQFEAIRKELLPQLRLGRGASRRVRFWSAAASTGQEAYSLAMLLLEEGFGGWNVEILATDINRQVLEKARRGVYGQLEINRGLPAPLLIKYFRRIGLDWQIGEQVRALVRFEEFDLREATVGREPFDAVLCRNVLIYFDAETKKRVLTNIARVLAPGGWLLLGGAETALGLEAFFERVTVGQAVVYRVRD